MKNLCNEILQDLNALFAYHETVGIDSYPLSEDLKTFLDRPVSLANEAAASRMAGPVSPAQETRKKTSPHVDEQAMAQSLDDLSQEVSCCDRCSLATARCGSVVGSGLAPVRLLVVGDWLSFADVVDLEQQPNFGAEQDLMLDRMFGAIRLPKKDIYVTNSIKCIVPGGQQPDFAAVQTCYRYLVRQITLLEPELILVMGLLPARIMLKSKAPLVRLRARLHQFTVPDDGRKIPLVVTYHPSFLLRNPEMKKATWEDLKYVARQLGLF